MQEITDVKFSNGNTFLYDRFDTEHRILASETDTPDETRYTPQVFDSELGIWKNYYTPENKVISESTLEFALIDTRIFDK